MVHFTTSPVLLDEMAFRTPYRQLARHALSKSLPWSQCIQSSSTPCAVFVVVQRALAVVRTGSGVIALRPSAVEALVGNTQQGKQQQQQLPQGGRRAYHSIRPVYSLTQRTSAAAVLAVGQARLKHSSGKKGGKGGKGGGKGQKGGAEEEAISLDDIAGVSETKDRYDKVLEGLKHEFQGLRGGKTDPGMLDHVQVDSYGSQTNLAAVAQASLKGPQLMVLTVYDPEMTKAVEDAVRECGMNLNPSVQGQGQVNVPIPKPTKESREAVAKVAAKAAEKAKVIMRGIRHKVLDQLKKKKDSFPEDDVHQRMKEIDKCTQEAEATAGKLLETKKKEIMML